MGSLITATATNEMGGGEDHQHDVKVDHQNVDQDPDDGDHLGTDVDGHGDEQYRHHDDGSDDLQQQAEVGRHLVAFAELTTITSTTPMATTKTLTRIDVDGHSDELQRHHRDKPSGAVLLVARITVHFSCTF